MKQESPNSENSPVVETIEMNPHPFFEKNDLNTLSIITPMLSSKAQRLISFFINFGSDEPMNSGMNLGNLFSQLSSGSGGESAIMDLAPSFLKLLSNQDGKNSGNLNPALITSLLSAFTNNKKED